MIVDLELYRKSKVSISVPEIRTEEENSTTGTAHVEFLICNEKHPAILEAIQRANKRSW